MSVPKSFSHHGFIQLPPDSTGKNMQTIIHLHLDYHLGTAPIMKKDIIVGETSGAEALVWNTLGTTQSGTLILMMQPNIEPTDFTVGENLLVDGTGVAQVERTYQIETQSACIVGANNPHYAQRIGPKGAAFVRYSDGEQQLDAFGLSRNSTPSQMAQYMFGYNTMPNEFLDETNGTGAEVVHLQDESSVALDVGTANGEYTYRTTHRYHLYQAGYPTLIEMTACCGDQGKAGVRRRWGLFDTTDGCFFELDGTSLSVVIRSSTDGTARDTKVEQADWNGDRVDGGYGDNNLSGMTLNPATINLYWIDIQWLGAGKVRFGMYDLDGNRIVMHTFQNGNAITTPFMSQANLPYRMEIENTALTASPSRVKMTCATVKIEGHLVDARSRKTFKWTADSGEHTVDSTAEKLMASFRSTATIDGRPNRKTTIPEIMSFYVEDYPVVVTVLEHTVLSGESFSAVGGGAAADVDTDATSYTGGDRLVSWCFDPGCHNVEMPQNFGLFSQNMILGSDGSQGNVYSIIGQCLASGQTAKIRFFPTLVDVV